jgi:hypothetical protein
LSQPHPACCSRSPRRRDDYRRKGSAPRGSELWIWGAIYFFDIADGQIRDDVSERRGIGYGQSVTAKLKAQIGISLAEIAVSQSEVAGLYLADAFHFQSICGVTRTGQVPSQRVEEFMVEIVVESGGSSRCRCAGECRSLRERRRAHHAQRKHTNQCKIFISLLPPDFLCS